MIKEMPRPDKGRASRRGHPIGQTLGKDRLGRETLNQTHAKVGDDDSRDHDREDGQNSRDHAKSVGLHRSGKASNGSNDTFQLKNPPSIL